MGAPHHRFVEFVRDTSASVAVEFVITLPIILAALVLVYELGRALLAYEIAGQDLRNAARYLTRVESVNVTNASDPGVLAAKNLAMTGTTSAPNCPSDYPPSSSTNCHYPWTSTSSILISASPYSDPPYNLAGHTFTLVASIPMSLSLLGFIGVPTGVTLSMSATAQYVGD